MKWIIALIMLAVGFGALGQGQDKGEITYQFKKQPFPYDSGVAISDRQYQFILSIQGLDKIQEKVTVPPPQIVIRMVEVKKKGDGNKLLWGGGGVVSMILVWVVSSVIKK